MSPTPAGEDTQYPTGASVQNVPDMPDPGPGAMTFFYTNQQSARLMFYHDHVVGVTRLDVYAGEAAPYILQDPTEKRLVHRGVIPSAQIPLVIQDKTFVPGPTQLAAEDPTWDTTAWGGEGNLWFPHVYMPNQAPGITGGIAPMGRWDYGPWLDPPATATHGPVANPLYDPVHAPWEAPDNPGVPDISSVPEAFMDTPVVNGTHYPHLSVSRKAYRFRILNASDERTLNLQLYYAKSNAPMWNADGTLNNASAGEVPMVPAVPTAGFPPSWPTDSRAGGVPDPAYRGPDMIQIGNESGFLPAPVVLPNEPIGYTPQGVANDFSTKTLFLGPAERADVIVDFSQVPAGSKLILYNDAPAPAPLEDPRYDYYTGDPDQTSTGGAPTTIAGYGPNTRTIMQFQVHGGTNRPLYLALLRDEMPVAYRHDQPPPIVPEQAYDAAFGTTTAANTYSGLLDTTLNWAGLLHDHVPEVDRRGFRKQLRSAGRQPGHRNQQRQPHQPGRRTAGVRGCADGDHQAVSGRHPGRIHERRYADLEDHA
jgi:FtsP/CotA-like multicopper oxidase with cupredoxin domain